MNKCLAVISGVFLFFGAIPAQAAETAYEIVIKDHQFSPVPLTVPAGQKIKITIINQDATPEEFESYPLNREKVVAGNSKITLFVGPLKAGSYDFFGDFHK